VNLDRDARQIAREKVAPAVRARLAFALRRFRRGSVTLRFFDRRVEVRLQLRLGRQQIAKCELQLARHAALAPRPEQPPLEQRVLMRSACSPAIVAAITSAGSSIGDDTLCSYTSRSHSASANRDQ
jgi:hypothetical protein